MQNRNYFIGTAKADCNTGKARYKRGEQFLFDCAIARQGVSIRYVCRYSIGKEYDSEGIALFDYSKIAIDVDTPNQPVHVPMGVAVSNTGHFQVLN